MKCYVFKATVCATVKGYVYAKSEEEAKELIMRKSYEEIDDTEISEVDDIKEIEEEL